MRKTIHALVLLALALPLPVHSTSSDRAGRQFTWDDLMKVRKITSQALAERGDWLGYVAEPGRGDGEAVLVPLPGAALRERIVVERGTKLRLSTDSRWAAIETGAGFAAQERSRKEKKKDSPELRPGLVLVDLGSGARRTFEQVKEWAFSEDSAWLAVHTFRPEPERDREDEDAKGAAPGSESPPEEPAAGEAEADDAPEKPPEPGSELLLVRLAADATQSAADPVRLADVERWAFSPSGAALAYSVSHADGADNALRLRRLADGSEQTLALSDWADVPVLAWAEHHDRLAYLLGVEREKDEVEELALWALLATGSDAEPVAVVAAGDVPGAWRLPRRNEISWSRNGERLFFGFAQQRGGEEAEEEPENAGEEDESAPDPYDQEAILAEREVDVWHWRDPIISPQQKQEWDEEKDRNFLAVAHLDGKRPRVVQLAAPELPDVEPGDASWLVATTDVVYRREATWRGRFADVVLVSVGDGSRIPAATHLPARGLARGLSPSGERYVYFDAGEWRLFERATGTTRSLTASLDTPFANEDHDYPSEPPGYGIAGWVATGDPAGARDRAVLVYDKYDLWQIPVDGGEPLRLTAGREVQRIFRLQQLDEEAPFLAPGSSLLLLAYDDRHKNNAFYRARLGAAGAELLYERDKKLTFLQKAEQADILLTTEETYAEFPDLWTTNLEFDRPQRRTDVNPQLGDFAWGSAELVEWSSLDGIPLQGVLIKPAGYTPGKRYPVLVYFYRFFSQRLYEFNDPAINHRPSFPIYAGDGYAIFLPDIRFEVGRPGLAAVKSLVPGVQKLIDLGIADPEAIGLHGHSWSGYQTAFIVTQTDLFAAAVAGAPVSNMTSAYSGIRWGSGLARQFQYEQSQSRIGGSLWETPLLYIENSPVFFADRITTPLLIMFGDEDGAVPWYQGIELYLALRRLDKPAVFLQYRGEPHHLRKYANKLDYSLRMKEFFDHFLEGAPAPAWWSEGEPYRGK